MHCICNVCHVVPNQQLSLFLYERARLFLLLQASNIILEWLLVCFCPAAESMGIRSGAGADGFSDCASVRQTGRETGRWAIMRLERVGRGEAKLRERCPSEICWGPCWQRNARLGPCPTAGPSRSPPALQSRHNRAP